MVIFEYNCNVIVMQLQYYCSSMHYKKNTIVKHELTFVCGEEEKASKIFSFRRWYGLDSHKYIVLSLN